MIDLDELRAAVEKLRSFTEVFGGRSILARFLAAIDAWKCERAERDSDVLGNYSWKPTPADDPRCRHDRELRYQDREPMFFDARPPVFDVWRSGRVSMPVPSLNLSMFVDQPIDALPETIEYRIREYDVRKRAYCEWIPLRLRRCDICDGVVEEGTYLQITWPFLARRPGGSNE